MNDIKKIAKEAEKALDKIKNGKTFPGSYVVARLETALQENPKDALIGHMRDVFSKIAETKDMVNQREIAKMYDHLYGMSGGKSRFREVAGDLLPDSHASIALSPNYAEKSRIPYEKALEPMYGNTKLSEELSGVFSLDKKGSFSAFSENTIKKAEKFTKIQLTSMGCVPQEVTAVRANDHFVLCKASVDTSDFTQVELSVPVQVTNGIPSLPTHFVQDNGLEKLNKENLYVFVKDKNNFKKKVARDNFAGQRAFGDLQAEAPVVPSSLEAYANIEDKLVEAAADFTSDQIAVARSFLASQMASFGIPNPQVKVASSNAKALVFSSSIPTNKGRVDIMVPVDMPNGSPVMPSKFSVAGEVFSLNEKGLRRVIDGVNQNAFNTAVSREVESMSRLSYDQLLGEVTAGVSKGDFRRSEDALGVIQQKFGGQRYLSALDTFSKLLKHSSENTDRDALIKQAFERGDLIRVPTSVQLYCPKLGLPVSKIAFDSKGRPVPAARKVGAEPLQNSGAMISNSKVVLS